MKDAFGSAFILRIMLVFFVVFICFMTVAISWARAFKIKNNVINIVEKADSSNIEVIHSRIDSYLNRVSYAYANNAKVSDDCRRRLESSFVKSKSASVLSGNVGGVCIVPIGSSDSYHYRVYSYFVVDFPLFQLGLVVPIVGESKTINSELRGV